MDLKKTACGPENTEFGTEKPPKQREYHWDLFANKLGQTFVFVNLKNFDEIT